MVAGGGLLLLFRSFRTEPGRINRTVQRAGKDREQVYTRVAERGGEARWRLYGLIGDGLDRKSGWVRGMDVIMRTLEEEPEAVVDFLVERLGRERVRAMLERGEEER